MSSDTKPCYSKCIRDILIKYLIKIDRAWIGPQVKVLVGLGILAGLRHKENVEISIFLIVEGEVGLKISNNSTEILPIYF